MNCLVTGGAGFLGYHLVKRLRELGHDVVSLDNGMQPCHAPDKEYKYADIRYIDDLREYIKNADTVFHLAAQISVDKSIANPQETIDINVAGTQNVLQLCRLYNVPMIFASSSEIYGSSQRMYMAEDHPLDAQSPYAASKVAGDRLCYSYYKTYGMDVRILRNFNTAGPYQNGYGAVFSSFIEKALHDKPLEVFGDGTQERDYMWVGDAIDAYLTIMDNGKPGMVLNAGTGKTVTVNEIAKLVLRHTGKDVKIVHTEPRPGEVQRLCCNNWDIRQLGWEPKENVDFIVEKMVEARLAQGDGERKIFVDGLYERKMKI